MVLKSLAAAASLLALGAAASAQDYSLDPTFGQVQLQGNFAPDPYLVSLRSGGGIDATSLSAADGFCTGYIADAPDFRLQYGGGAGFPLVFSVESSDDTTLVINGPDGRWYCDDDGGGFPNPRYIFLNAPAGQYDIWVGSYAQPDEFTDAILRISEVE